MTEKDATAPFTPAFKVTELAASRSRCTGAMTKTNIFFKLNTRTCGKDTQKVNGQKHNSPNVLK